MGCQAELRTRLGSTKGQVQQWDHPKATKVGQTDVSIEAQEPVSSTG